VTSNTALSANDTVILANTKRGPLTITLPSARANAGRYYLIKLQVGGHEVKIKPQAGETIDGEPLVTVRRSGVALSLISGGLDWASVAKTHTE
jgi:hypothetical protein